MRVKIDVSWDKAAFFDSSYRTRVDLDYFAARWRKAGIEFKRRRLVADERETGDRSGRGGHRQCISTR